MWDNRTQWKPSVLEVIQGKQEFRPATERPLLMVSGKKRWVIVLVFSSKRAVWVSLVSMLSQVGPQSNTTIDQSMKMPQLRIYSNRRILISPSGGNHQFVEIAFITTISILSNSSYNWHTISSDPPAFLKSLF